MIEAKFNSERVVVNSFFTSVLKLIDKVFMTNLSKSSPFFSINVNVVNKERSIIENTNTVTKSVKSKIVSVDNKILEKIELNPESNFMVLKSNKRKGKTRVGIAPEDKRYE